MLCAEGAQEVTVPLSALLGFAVVETAPPAEGAARMTTPDALLVVAWQELGLMRRAQMPVPREGLQVQLALARLAQLKPDADLRGLPRDELTRFFEVAPPAPVAHAGGGKRGVLLASLLVAVLVAGWVLWALAQGG